MSTVPVFNPNRVVGSSDERFLTQTLLDSMVLSSYKKQLMLFNSQFISLKPLAAGQATERWKIRGDSPEDAEHHTRGQRILGGTRVNSYVDISVDDDLIKALEIDWADQQLSKWDEVAPAMEECVRIVSEKIENRLFRVGINAARTASVTNVHNGGNRVVRYSSASLAAGYPLSATGADNFADDASNLALAMDLDDIPRDSNRHLFITPYIAQVLTRGTNRIINKDYADPANFSIEMRDVGVLEGFRLHITRFMPDASVTTDLTKYNVTASSADTGLPAALALYNPPSKNDKAPGAIGGVTAGGIRNKVWYDERYNSWMAKTQIMAGFGVLAPWCAGEICVLAAAS